MLINKLCVFFIGLYVQFYRIYKHFMLRNMDTNAYVFFIAALLSVVIVT